MNSKIISAIATIALLGWSSSAMAQESSVKMANGVEIRDAKVQKVGSNVSVTMDIDFSAIKLSSDNSINVTPALVGETDTLRLANMSVLGRNRYFYYLRNDISMTSSAEDRAWRKKDAPDTLHFSASVPYRSWMNGARLMINEIVLGCCNKTLEDTWAATPEEFKLPAVSQYVPAYVFRSPKAEVRKTRSLSATSYVDFPVSETVIYPDYRENRRELARIVATIDSVMQDKDVTISEITLCGFASPESPYSNNVRLAKGRTAAIKTYISKFNHVSASMISTDYVPENWMGLREWVLSHDVPNAEGIISIIDGQSLAPDPKEALLKKTYPKEYKYLLENCYPGLRKVDYTIMYEVRHFVTVEEIRAAYESDPGKLSKDEFYMLSGSLPQDDPMHDRILKDAVKYFPSDPATNLNAANVAMKEGRLREAGEHLDKAGDTMEAVYARGVYAALTGDYARAEEYLTRVQGQIPEAEDALAQVRTIVTLRSLWAD